MQRWTRTSDFFRQAPACIAVMMGCYESIADQVLAARGTADPEAAAMLEARSVGASRLQSAAAAINTLMLALHQQGLGSLLDGRPAAGQARDRGTCWRCHRSWTSSPSSPSATQPRPPNPAPAGRWARW